MAYQSFFKPGQLPDPRDFYLEIFPELKNRSIQRPWVQVRCCFHKDSHPSLSLHLPSGGFYCFGCGARGGDIIDFIMQRDHLTFKQACGRLGACKYD